MLKSLIFFFQFFLFWLLFFCLDRLLFLCIFYKKLQHFAISEIIAPFYHAIRLDLSMAAYFALLPLLTFVFWYFTQKKQVKLYWVTAYNKILIVVVSLIAVTNFNIYREWGTKINDKAIEFAFSTPNEALASSASSPILLSLTILFALIFSGLLLEKKLVNVNIEFEKTPIWIKIIISVLLLGGNFLLIRGGWQLSPINQSMAYFSEKQILNHATVNTEWNLISGLLSAKQSKSNPYKYFNNQEATQTVSNLFKTATDSTISILKTTRPNVVLFIMESFTADLTQTLGNENGITPHFDSLINKGFLFDQIYSSGDRTDKGLVATLAGFPTLAAGSIVKWPEKMQKMPSISQEFNQMGYKTSFFYGGESEFDNYKAFILSHGYHKLIDKSNFNKDEMNSKWGAFDGVVLNRQLKELKLEHQPFFSTLLTLTNHEPFEVPGAYKFGKKDNVQRFKSTAYYTDSCINAYLTEAKKQHWYKNTLFIFIADHGHLLPKNTHEIFDPKRYHIPLLMYGDVIKDEFKGKRFNQVGSQVDLAATLLAQLNISSKQFVWSKNLLNPNTKHFAFFSWDNGLGFMDNKQSVTFDNVGKTILYNSKPNNKAQTNKLLKNGQSFLQKVYQEFIEL